MGNFSGRLRLNLNPFNLVRWIDSWPFDKTLRFQACADAEIKTVPRHFARANQADRCIDLLHCAQRSTPWMLDTRGCDRKVECFSLFQRYVTLRHLRSVHGRVHSINLFAVSATGCCVPRNLTTSSFGEKETNFFSSKFAVDSSTPLSKGLLLLYLTFKSMPKAKFWRCQYCRGRSRRRCQHSTSGPITASLRSTNTRAWLPWPTARPDTFCGVLATRSWSELRELVEVWSSP